MNCPACNKNHASLLSVCPSCGTMINDSVREELALKISPVLNPLKKAVEEKPVLKKSAEFPLINQTAESVSAASPIEPKSEKISLPTDKFAPKPTSPILVEFQSKNAVIPEWRLQLQNSIRRRHSGQTEFAPTTPHKVLVTSGANALKAERTIEPGEQPDVITATNPTLEKALRRIEESRQKYLTEDKPKTATFPAQQKSFPHIVPNKSFSFPLNKAQDTDKAATGFKEKFSANPSKTEKFDTNKLPPLPLKVSTIFEKKTEIAATETKKDKENFLQIKADESHDVTAYTEITLDAAEFSKNIETDNAELDGDDRAPMMMRFNAGFFDLIIGGFTSFILLAPFTLASGNLFSFQGLLAFLATCSIVMFIYLTATIGTMGRTFGMKIFSLEIVDIEENDYPTFHQAAVSSSVYLVSLALGGIGFLTLFLNDENRAAHDLISGTIVVKEYE